MAYIEKTIIAGEHIFKEKSFSARYGKKNIPRGPNWNECSEVQRRRNELLKKKTHSVEYLYKFQKVGLVGDINIQTYGTSR